MEITANQLLGLNVYSLEKGERIGIVKGFLPDPKEKEIVALLVTGKKLRKEESILCLADVSGLSAEAVTVDSPAVLRKKADCPHLKDLLKTAPVIEGLSVLQKDGTFLGRAVLVYMDSESGKISRIELRNSHRLSGLRKNRTYLTSSDIDIIGHDMILAKEGAEVREETLRTPSAMKETLRRHIPKTEPGCGPKIMAMSDRYPLPRKHKTVFPEVPHSKDEE